MSTRRKRWKRCARSWKGPERCSASNEQAHHLILDRVGVAIAAKQSNRCPRLSIALSLRFTSHATTIVARPEINTHNNIITSYETGGFDKISACPGVRASTNLKPIAAIMVQQKCAQATRR